MRNTQQTDRARQPGSTSGEHGDSGEYGSREHGKSTGSRDRNTAREHGTGRKQSSGARSGRVPVAEAMRLAAGQLAELLRSEPDSVSSVKAVDDGWTADVEVVEIERVPETTSVMGSYRVQLDAAGNLLGYERTRRYARGQIDQRK
ncbi:gas vesicle protein [Streptomyces nanshensis]|nr:gas vesicle protein [Streptomyces nanshensis]